MNTDASPSIPPDVRAAISAFLEECKKNARPFAASEALAAIRCVFPSTEIPDLDLLEAITSEASVAGLDFEYDVPSTSDALKRRSLERWHNEGGAIEKSPRQETQCRLDNDTDGSRRRATDTKNSNRLV